MNRLRAIICIGMTLCAVMSRAERSSENHNFWDLTRLSKIEYSNSYRVGATSLLTYTGSGSAAFGEASGTICLNLSSLNDSVTTTKVEQLAGFQMTHTQSGLSGWLEVAISKDSVAWKVLTGDSIDYRGTATDCSFPRGNYFIRLKHVKSGKNPVNILSIIYYFDKCNCFVYTEE